MFYIYFQNDNKIEKITDYSKSFKNNTTKDPALILYEIGWNQMVFSNVIAYDLNKTYKF